MVPLCSRSSDSVGVRPAASSATGSSSDSSGSSDGKYRTFSSNRSKIDVIHRSPNHTRGRTPCVFNSSGRVSVAWANSSMRVSAHSRWPKKYGELAPSASCGPASTWAAFQLFAKSPGDTCRCNCILVQADSGAIEAVCRLSRSGPWMSMSMSSPRAVKIESLSAW